MSKVVYIGAALTRSIRDRLKSFPKRHLMLVTAMSIGILTLVGIVPSSDVKANKANTPLQIDAFAPESVQSDLLAIATPDSPLEPQQKKPQESEEQRLVRSETGRHAEEASSLAAGKV